VPLAASLYAPACRKVDASTLLGEPISTRGRSRTASLTLLVDSLLPTTGKLKSSTRITADNTRYGEIYGHWTNGCASSVHRCAQTTIGSRVFALQAHYVGRPPTTTWS